MGFAGAKPRREAGLAGGSGEYRPAGEHVFLAPRVTNMGAFKQSEQKQALAARESSNNSLSLFINMMVTWTTSG